MSSVSYKNIYIYIAKEILISFFVSFLFFFFIFFINQILLIAEKILSKKVPLMDVLLLLIYYLPSIVNLALPFSALVGSLMAIGRFTSDNEILAFRACGISLFRVFLPVVVISVFFTFITFIFSDYFLPLGYINSNVVYKKMMYSNPGLELEPYAAKRYEDKAIVTGNVQGNRIDDVVIFDKTQDNQKRIITARTAYLLENEEQKDVISLKLVEVFSHITEPGKAGDYEYSYASELVYNILIRNIIGGNTPIDPGPREMSSIDVFKSIVEKEAILNDRTKAQAGKIERIKYDMVMEIEYAMDIYKDAPYMINQSMNELKLINEKLQREKTVVIEDKNLKVYQLEFYRKFSHPFSCVVFMIFAFPVGLIARKSGRLVGFAVGVIVSALYWVMLFISYRLGISVDSSTFFVIWFPNFIILLLGLGMYGLRLKR